MSRTMAIAAIPVPAEIRRPAEWSGKDLGIGLVLATLSIVYLWPFRSAFGFPNPDEGIILQGAARVLQGQLPYRDFFSFYAPGSYYWNALLLKAFGDSVLVPRTALVLYGAFFSLLTFALARRMASRKAALVPAVLLLICGLPLAFYVIHNWDSTVAALIALYCAVLLVERPRSWLAAVIGLFTGLSVLFNQARGLGLLLGLVLGLLVLRWRLGRKDLLWRYFAWMGAGVLLPLVSAAAFFALQGGLRPMAACLVWPFRHYTTVNHLPYGYIAMSIGRWNSLFNSPLPERVIYALVLGAIFVLCALPIFVVLVAGWCALQRRRDLAPEHVAIAVLCGSVTLGSLLSVQATRPDYFHVTFIAPLFFFVLPWICQAWAAPFPSLRKAGPAALVILLFASGTYGIALMWSALNSTISIQTRRGTIRVVKANETIPFIQANFATGSPLLVHPYLPLYSFLTRTIAPLPYDYLQPGMHSQEQFQDAAARLAALKPPAVLFQTDFILVIPGAWPRTPFAATYDPVADYIAHNYKACWRLDARTDTSFLFLVRTDLQCGSYKLP